MLIRCCIPALASLALLSGCGGASSPPVLTSAQSTVSHPGFGPSIERFVTASKPTLSKGIAAGTGTWDADISQGLHVTLKVSLYEGTSSVASAAKTVYGPATPFSVTAKYTCKAKTKHSFSTHVTGTYGNASHKSVYPAQSAAVTLACM